ncbi:hypothetical protein EV175_006971, partial [Coemansia sp. RSA 1933]
MVDFSFVTPRRKHKGQARSRLAPMDIDFNDTDDSWLNQPYKQQLSTTAVAVESLDSDEHQRLVSTRMEHELEQEKEQHTPRAPVFSDSAPFTFSMTPPPPPEPAANPKESPMAIDSKAVRSTDHQPISPKALRRIYTRRQRQQQKARRSLDDNSDDGSSQEEAISRNGSGD